jgi:hypothetical protein
MITSARQTVKQTRKLVKRSPYVRNEIHQAARAEDDGTKGAKEHREKITADFQRAVNAVGAAIATTASNVADFERAQIILETGTRLKSAGVLSDLAAAAIGVLPTDRLKNLSRVLAAAAGQGASMLERAESYLDDYDAELRSVGLKAQFHAFAATYGIDHPKTRAVKADYLATSALAADRRKGIQRDQ